MKRRGVARIIAHEPCPECGDRFCDGNKPHDGLNAGVPVRGSPLYIAQLPRCLHGSCLVDGDDEVLDPPCGCTADPALALKRIISCADGVNQRNLGDACLRLHRIVELARMALRAGKLRTN